MSEDWTDSESDSDASPPEDMPKRVLEGGDLKAIAKYIASPKCKNIVVLAGAGISTSAGIPDFRSPDTGLYANLERFNLPYPEAVFDISFFRRNPAPFYLLAKELAPGLFRPTPTHSFIRLLADKGLLGMCFTQNIDTLERMAGVPADKLVEAHGSFASNACIECKKPFDDAKMREAVEKQTAPHCEKCGGLVKPNITFFGEGLPEVFFKSIGTLAEADLVIVLGTSLTVHPFASLPSMAPKKTPRMLINLQRVGDLGGRPNDVIVLDECDVVVRKLCEALGWTKDLEKTWAATESLVNVDKRTKGKEGRRKDAEAKAERIASQVEKDSAIHDSMAALSRALQEQLDLSEDHRDKVLRELDKEEKDALAKAATSTSAEPGPELSADVLPVEKPAPTEKAEVAETKGKDVTPSPPVPETESPAKPEEEPRAREKQTPDSETPVE